MVEKDFWNEKHVYLLCAEELCYLGAEQFLWVLHSWSLLGLNKDEMAQELKVLLTYPFCFLWEGACAVGEALQRAHLGISMLRVEGETMLEKVRNCRLMFLF